MPPKGKGKSKPLGSPAMTRSRVSADDTPESTSATSTPARRSITDLVEQQTFSSFVRQHRQDKADNERLQGLGRAEEPSAVLTENRTEFKYLNIHSHHLDLHKDRVSFDVNLLQPIRNAKKVAIHQFSTANTGNNFAFGHNKFRWIEFRDNAGVAEARGYSISIPDGYYTSAEVATAFNFAVSALATHNFAGEVSPTINMSYSTTTYKQTLELTSTAGDRWFLPVFNSHEVNDWHRTGFQGHFTTFQYDDSASWGVGSRVQLGVDTDLAYYANGVLTNTAQARGMVRFGAQTDIVASCESLVENNMGWFIKSSLATNSTYETHRKLNKNVAQETNVLAWISNESSRYSFVHYTAHHLMWQSVHQDRIQSMNLQILNDQAQPMHPSQLRDWVLTLVFECEVHATTSADEMRRAYASAYRADHPTRVEV